ncbi:DUF4307 domain-containing protein [Kribbella sp. NPDC023855]|uniref:DUF4307 domain-containing protein n=1 Tax=Kribbella sp. NPDC023855 TaxID=3154698 RepID=UPI0033F48E0A
MTDPRPAAPTGSRSAALDARYGRTGRGRKPLLFGVIGALALVALVWLLWVALIQSNPPVSSRLLGFRITSPTSATATIQVDRSKSVEAQCRLQAKAADFSIVGEITVTVAADSPRQQAIDATLTTQRAATAVVLVGCTTADAHRPN